MPMPGSQQIDSLDVAYFLHTYRWYFRLLFGVMILIGAAKSFQGKRKWIPALALASMLIVVYAFNFEMLADKMFRQPEKLTFKTHAENLLMDSSVVLGVEYNGEAKAYPIRYIAYHHQVRDIIGGTSMMITYCNVCRSGRVFQPIVNNHTEEFRLVGMNHFNAMFEDATTKSWWRQATGEAVAGPLKGHVLPVVESTQLTLKKWFELYPQGVVMQLDSASREEYDSLGRFERGKSKGKLTRTDSLSWKDKSWVVGIQLNDESKAYDWNRLKEERIINDQVGGKSVVLVLSLDGESFVAFERPAGTGNFTFKNDTLFVNDKAYDFAGRDLSTLREHLTPIKAYQEFWHSWRTFHPDTKQYQ